MRYKIFMDNITDERIEENKGLVGFTITKFFPTYNGDEDMEQEGLVALWMAMRKYDKDKGVKFSTYATTCIRNHLRGVIRKEQAEKRYIPQTKIISIHSYAIIGNEELRIKDCIEDNLQTMSSLELDEILDNYNERDRLIVMLRTIGYTAKEVAEETDVSGQTVRRVWESFRKDVVDCLL